MDNVLSFINSLDIDKNEYVVVACSGGPDSMFLLNLLYKYDYKIIVAHVNHKLRSESDDEYKFVENFCREHQIIFEGTIIKEYKSGNVEKYGREFRYNFFKEIMKKYKSKYLFTAHHGDDLIETILMRITRGSSLKGYAGFLKISKQEDYNIVRPLIYLTKSEIEYYNKENSIPYVIDESNNHDDYTRNRFRHIVLPFLKSEDMLVHEKFIHFSDEINDAYNFIDEIIKEKIDIMYKDNILDLNYFIKEKEYIKINVLKYILAILYPDNLYLINHHHIDELLKIIDSNKPNISIILPNNINVKKVYNKLIFNSGISNIDNYKYELKDNLIIDDYMFKFNIKSDSKSNYIIRLNSKDIKLPLYVRNRNNGDKMQVKNMIGTKKINDIFIDSKIEKEKRDKWPIVVDSNNEIIWIPGLKKSKFDIPFSDEYDIIIAYEKKERM